MACLKIKSAFFLPNLTTPFFAFTLIACSLFRAESKAAFYRSPVNRYDFAYPIFMGLCLYGLGNLSPMLHVYAPSHDKLIPFVLIFTYVVLGIVGCYLFHERPIRFSLGLLVIYAISTIIPLKGSLPFDPNMLILIGAISLILALKNHVLFSASTAFGKISVIDHPDLNVHLLKNGSIVHGVQFWDPARRGEPLAYYNRKGPIGDVFSRLGLASATNIGVVGLGAGTLAAYGTKGQTFTFFEINPFVVDLAQNPNYFTYLHDSPAQINCITGEGRDHISKAAPGTFDALFIDGYHADYTPLELYTAEAVETYLNALTENGILVFHISSSTTAIQAALAKIAETLNLKGAFRRDSADSRMHSTEVSVTPRGLIAFNKSQTPAINDRVKLYMDYIDDFLTRCGILKTPQGATTPYLHLDSEWVVMSRSVEMIEPVIKECQWHELHTLKDLPLLTDKSILQAAIIKMYREAFELVVATP